MVVFLVFFILFVCKSTWTKSFPAISATWCFHVWIFVFPESSPWTTFPESFHHSISVLKTSRSSACSSSLLCFIAFLEELFIVVPKEKLVSRCPPMLQPINEHNIPYRNIIPFQSFCGISPCIAEMGKLASRIFFANQSTFFRLLP